MRLFLVSVIFVVGLAPISHGAFAQDSPPATTKTAVFAGGCFWCIQPAFDKAPGVIKTTVGYCGGTEPNPTYELVGSEKTNYRESIQIVYDPARISYEQLLDIYWKQIDPTQSDGQFTDIGPSYRAAIFYGSDEEKKIAEMSKEKLAHSGKFKKLIATEIGNEAARRIGDRGEHGHRAIACGERRGLLRSRNGDETGARERRDADAKHKEILNRGRTLASPILLRRHRVEGARAF